MPTEAYALCRIVPHMRARKAISMSYDTGSIPQGIALFNEGL